MASVFRSWTTKQKFSPGSILASLLRKPVTPILAARSLVTTITPPLATGLSILCRFLDTSSRLLVATPHRHLTGPNNSIFGYVPSFRPERVKRKKRTVPSFGEHAFQDKPIQEWHEWDGFGRYKYRHHNYPNNYTLRDVQRRRIFKLHAQDRLRLNAVRKCEILPKEIRRLADEEILKVPRASGITNINRRCTLSGRARGIFHQFRVSRMVFRAEADYNKVSGVQRAIWMYGIHIKP